jgi:ATP-dependent Clp protease ATP-binding subunit ClpC
MAAYRFPVLLWQDAAGQFGGCAVEDPASAVAAGPTRSSVLDQLKDYFTWSYKKEPWRGPPEYDAATLTQYKVQVRPEYVDKGRIYPSDPVGLLVACVHGQLESGLMYGTLPLLGVTFSYHAGDKLRDTVSYYVQQSMKGRTLEELMRFLPPVRMELDEIIVHVPRAARAAVEAPEVKTLDAVADPISSRRYRSGLSRPWERDAEVERVTTLLAKEKTSAILLGPAGSGKSAVLVAAARKAQLLAGAPDEGQEERPSPLPRIWMTSAARLIAGMRYLGQWQERCDALVAELTLIGGVLCIERLLDLVLAGSDEPSAGVGAYLVPFLQRGELRLVAEATAEELDTCRRLLPSLVDACQVLTVPALSREQSIAALQKVADLHAKNARIILEDSTVPLAFRLFHRFQPYLPMPGPAANFLIELVDQAAVRKAGKVDADAVFQAFVQRSGLPDWLLHDELPLQREDVLADLRKGIIGQEPAIAAAADVILTFKAGVNDPHRPLAVLLFAGPTGVGKTELARAISRYLFGHGGDANRMVRLDMSEYSGPGAATRFLGPPGGEPSALIQRIRQQPFSVVLLDEIEKASPEIFDLLLGLFDEGRLTDRYGRLTTFRSSVLIMTSNLGAAAGEPFGLTRASGRSYESEILSFFRPEFFNRIDAVVAFQPLGAETMRRIAIKELGDIAARQGLVQRGIRFSWTDSVVQYLLDVGFDRRYGARPLQRAIETAIVTPLAKEIAAAGRRHASVRADVGAGVVTLRFT